MLAINISILYSLKYTKSHLVLGHLSYKTKSYSFVSIGNSILTIDF